MLFLFLLGRLRVQFGLPLALLFFLQLLGLLGLLRRVLDHALLILDVACFGGGGKVLTCGVSVAAASAAAWSAAAARYWVPAWP